MISSFGLALFNASVGAKDVLGQTMGVVYTVLAILMVGYAYRMQQRRRHRIIYRFSGHHGQHRSFLSQAISIYPASWSLTLVPAYRCR